MPTIYTKSSFPSTYKDDYDKTKNYHRVLFNSGKALQARELTQMQTIIQSEISQLAGNIFEEGAAITPGSFKVDNTLEFIKINPLTPFPSDPSLLEGVEFSVSNLNPTIKFRVIQTIAAVNGDPDTLYVEYTGDVNTGAVATRVSSGSTITSTTGGFTFEVQSINTSNNPAVGLASEISVDEGHFFVQGRVVYCPPQSLIFGKYSTNQSSRFGFLIDQEIVTVDDDITLYDNQGETPNLTSPGADRYRITLTLADGRTTTVAENFVQVIEVLGGAIVNAVTANSGLKSIKEEMATRTRETAGDYVKRYFRSSFEPNDLTTMKLKITPGTAYVQGYRINKDAESTIIVKKPIQTLSRNNDSITVNYGNYFIINAPSSQGMADFENLQELKLFDAVGGTGNIIGTTRVRAVSPIGDSRLNLYVFNTRISDATKSVRDIRSIGTGSGSGDVFYNLILSAGLGTNRNTRAALQQSDKRPLLFDTPISRPKIFSDISLTVAKRKVVTSDGSGNVTINASSGNALDNVGSWIISNATEASIDDAIISFGASSTSISGLANNQVVTIQYFEKISNAQQRVKTLTPVSDTFNLVEDSAGVQSINLRKTDIYSIDGVREDSANGKNILNLFRVDYGQRDTHYDLGRLLYNGSGLDSAGQNVHVSFKHFQHANGDGEFFGVNSYDGTVDYAKIPVHRTEKGRLVNLRDVLDFRPSVDSNGDFGSSSLIFGLPASNNLVNADAEYYMPRLDKLVLSKSGELRYIQGVSSMMPKFPSTPVDCIDLYKIELGANTLHTKDLKTTIIPRRGYTMEDIGKLDKRVDRLEQATTLSLLELNATNERLFDSDGNERIHTGFFVDNFKNQKFMDTKSIEHRASHDPTKGIIRPGYTCDTVEMLFDSNHSSSNRMVQKGDNLYLDHTEVQYFAQNMASQTINVNPFHVEKTYGDLVLSPSKDTWKAFKQDAPLVVDGGTEFDASQALLWNEQEYAWGGTNVNDLRVGMTTAPLVESTSNTTQTGESTRQTGEDVSVDHGDWVETGSTSTSAVISTDTEVLSRDHNQVPGDFVTATTTSEGAYTGVTLTKLEPPAGSTYSNGSSAIEAKVKDEIVITATQAWGRVFRCGAHRDIADLYKQNSGGGAWTLISNFTTSISSGMKVKLVGKKTGSCHLYFKNNSGTGQGASTNSNDGTHTVTFGLGGVVTTTTTDVYQTNTDTVTTSHRDVSTVETVTNTSYERTNTVTTETETETTQEFTTTTDTTSTVNRIASESVLTEVVDNRELQIIHVPFMRSRKVSFKATNLRPNTRYFPFFNNTDVRDFCKPKTFYKSSTYPDPDYTIADDGSNMVTQIDIPPGLGHSEGSGDLISNSNGIIEGEFEIPNLVNPPMRFKSGSAVFSLFDISKPDVSHSLSYCAQFYTSAGVIENLTGDYTITNTRVLEIVGGQTTTTTSGVHTETTTSTDTVVTTESEVAGTTETTQTQVYGNVETNTEIVGDTTVLVTSNTSTQYSQAAAGSAAAGSGTGTTNPSTTFTVDGKTYDPNDPVVAAAANQPKYQKNAMKHNKDEDPTAQSFEVLDPNGIYITRLRLYFAEKPGANDEQHTVSVAITQAPNGYPDRTRRVPGSFKEAVPSQVRTVPDESIASMVANGTDFIFDEPVFLQGGGSNYAIIVRSLSMKYKMYISEVEQFQLGSTERRIMKQPTLGSLFVSQNTDVWEPRGKQDLAYVLYRADFETSGTAFLHNRNLRPQNLVANPIMTTAGSDIVTMKLGPRDTHGMRQGDKTRVFGLNPNTRYNGILGSSIINGASGTFSRVVTSVDANSISFAADSDATASGRTGGGKVRMLQHLPYETIRPDFDLTQPETTNATLSFKMTTNSTLCDSDQGRFEVDNNFQVLPNKSNTTLNSPFAIYNQFEETSETSLVANEGHSLTSNVIFTTTDPRVSPVLDLESTDLKLTSNIIDASDQRVVNTYLNEKYSQRVTFVDEIFPGKGTAAAKHVCIPIKLAETAVGLRVMMSVNRPPETGFVLYYRTASKDVNIKGLHWTPVPTQNDMPADVNRNTFREYGYLIGGLTGELDPFDQFQLKMVFGSTNAAKVPLIKDLRCIALAD